MTLDLSREVADTRRAPDAEAVLDYRSALAPTASRLVYRLRVDLEAFYTAFYEAALSDGSAGRGADAIRETLACSRASQFVFYKQQHALEAR